MTTPQREKVMVQVRSMFELLSGCYNGTTFLTLCLFNLVCHFEVEWDGDVHNQLHLSRKPILTFLICCTGR